MPPWNREQQHDVCLDKCATLRARLSGASDFCASLSGKESHDQSGTSWSWIWKLASVFSPSESFGSLKRQVSMRLLMQASSSLSKPLAAELATRPLSLTVNFRVTLPRALGSFFRVS